VKRFAEGNFGLLFTSSEVGGVIRVMTGLHFPYVVKKYSVAEIIGFRVFLNNKNKKMKIIFSISEADFNSAQKKKLKSNSCECKFAHMFYEQKEERVPMPGAWSTILLEVEEEKEFVTWASQSKYRFLKLKNDYMGSMFCLIFEGAIGCFGSQALMPRLPKDINGEKYIQVWNSLVLGGHGKNFFSLKELRDEHTKEKEKKEEEIKKKFLEAESLSELYKLAERLLSKHF